MRRFFRRVKSVSFCMYVISGVALVAIMLLTVADVILRMFNRPITGIYDLTILLAGIVIGLAIPLSTWRRAHVRMLFVMDRLSPNQKKVVTSFTYLLAMFLFFLVGRGLLLYGLRMYRAGEVSMTMHLPVYPVVFGIGISCLINCIVLVNQLIGNFGLGETDES